MSKLGLLRTSIRSTLAARSQTHRLLRQPPRLFSTEAPPPPQSSAPVQPSTLDATIDHFSQNESKGLVYGRLLGISRNTLKTDVVKLLEGCNLVLEDVKVQYTGTYVPMSMMVQFHSHNAFNTAVRVIRGLNPLFKLELIEHHRWDAVTYYDGKTVLIEGLPRTALTEDVERFLSGTPYNGHIKLFTRQGPPEIIKLALVSFPSQIQAMNAYISKNKGFIHNSQVLMRVLQ